MTTRKIIVLTIWTFVGKMMSLLFSMLCMMSEKNIDLISLSSCSQRMRRLEAVWTVDMGARILVWNMLGLIFLYIHLNAEVSADASLGFRSHMKDGGQ